MNRVKERESKISKVIEGIKMMFTALAVNNEIIPNDIELQAEQIRSQENGVAIKNLEVATTSVNIPLKDVVEKAHIDEKVASKKADEVKKGKKKEELQNEIMK